MAEVKGAVYPLVQVSRAGVTNFVSWTDTPRSIGTDGTLGVLVRESDGNERPITNAERVRLNLDAEDWTDY